MKSDRMRDLNRDEVEAILSNETLKDKLSISINMSLTCKKLYTLFKPGIYDLAIQRLNECIVNNEITLAEKMIATNIRIIFQPTQQVVTDYWGRPTANVPFKVARAENLAIFKFMLDTINNNGMEITDNKGLTNLMPPANLYNFSPLINAIKGNENLDVELNNLKIFLDETIITANKHAITSLLIQAIRVAITYYSGWDGIKAQLFSNKVIGCIQQYLSATCFHAHQLKSLASLRKLGKNTTMINRGGDGYYTFSPMRWELSEYVKQLENQYHADLEISNAIKTALHLTARTFTPN